MTEPYRVTVNMPQPLAKRVKDYWHQQQLTSVNEAIRALLEQALDAAEKRKARQK